ncbi:MAG: hypothetical protein IPP71_09890 [Bacteroidetes bacterium]|nr:hypothetical protein [Bacteroidota bacterium]
MSIPLGAIVGTGGPVRITPSTGTRLLEHPSLQSNYRRNNKMYLESNGLICPVSVNGFPGEV